MDNEEYEELRNVEPEKKPTTEAALIAQLELRVLQLEKQLKELAR